MNVKWKLYLGISFLFLLCFCPFLLLSADTKTAVKGRTRPIIIWNHNIYKDSIDALETAVSTDLITHVNIKRLHRYDCLIEKYAKYEDMVPKVIDLCKQNNVKVILTRTLWPSWRISHSNKNDLYQSEYYIREIEHLKNDANSLGADYIGLDIEPYAKSPLKKIIKKRNYNRRDLEILKNAVRSAKKETGGVDFIYPAGSNLVHHPYNIISQLATYRISEHTYYDNKDGIKNVKYPFEIFGAFVKLEKENSYRKDLPFFLVEDIFDRSELWSDKKGVWLYKGSSTAKEKNYALKLAKRLEQYVKNLSKK